MHRYCIVYMYRTVCAHLRYSILYVLVYTVRKANQNEAFLWKIAVLRMKSKIPSWAREKCSPTLTVESGAIRSGWRNPL
jgi:hypothetical protein